MTVSMRASAPWHLWLIGGLMVLWNGFGAFDFTATVAHFEPYMANFPQELKDYVYGFPWWMFAIWGAAVFGGLAGSIFLLMRNKLATALLGLSFACAVISMAVSFIRPAPEGASDPAMAAVIIVIAALLFFYALAMEKKGVLR